MKVLLFGMLAEDVGKSEIEMDALSDSDSLKEYMFEKYPTIQNRQFMIAVNQSKTDKNIALHANDEIALIPPFAGG